MKLSFHPHALRRIEQRFGFHDQPIPVLQMASVGKATPVGRRFKIHFRGITFVCTRETHDQVLVITVFPDHTTRKRAKRLQRLSKKEGRRRVKKQTKNLKHGGHYQ
jgi:hypothetical protein